MRINSYRVGSEVVGGLYEKTAELLAPGVF